MVAYHYPHIRQQIYIKKIRVQITNLGLLLAEEFVPAIMVSICNSTFIDTRGRNKPPRHQISTLAINLAQHQSSFRHSHREGG
jgi:hypothetical protein